MTPTGFGRARLKLDLTMAEAGRALGVAERTVHRWENGRTPIPAAIAALMRAALKYASVRKDLEIADGQRQAKRGPKGRGQPPAAG
jgi:transcriptional regulator with XRE-family HTH domain